MQTLPILQLSNNLSSLSHSGISVVALVEEDCHTRFRKSMALAKLVLVFVIVVVKYKCDISFEFPVRKPSLDRDNFEFILNDSYFESCQQGGAGSRRCR